MAISIEQLIVLLLTLLFPPVFSLVVLVTFLAIFGKSLGIRQAYVRLLIRIFEWASHLSHKKPAKSAASHVDDVQLNGDVATSLKESDMSDESSSEVESEDLKVIEESSALRKRNPSANSLIKRTSSEKMLAKKFAEEEPTGSPAFTVVQDSFDFIKAGVEAIIEDDVTSRFTAEELPSWNLLTRTHAIYKGYKFINWPLTILYVLGFFMRYFLLLPGRIMLLIIGLTWLVASTAVIGCIPDGPTKKWLNWHASLMSMRILSRSLSAIVTYHCRDNRATSGGICVANHTSPIDVVMLACDNCYAYVGQRHGGLLGLMQRAVSRATHHVWFERNEANDRSAVTRRLREHVEDLNKLPILIFPEGTCINNTSVMMFKKGSFEVGGVIYPVAIKYDPRFGDPFWNSSKQGYAHYLLMMMTSWAIVCDVYYLPPVTLGDGENPIDFASRVKGKIAEAGGLVDLEWDGQLKRMPVKSEMKEKQRENYSHRVRKAASKYNSPPDHNNEE